MKICILQLGKTEDEHLKALINTFESRLKHYISIDIITIPELKNTKSLTPAQFKEKEAELILRHISEKEYVILLDERGRETDSKEFANLIQQKMNQSIKELTFLIGGAYGVSDKIKEKIHFKLSLSKLTFPHQLIRLIFMEQLYRAMTIIRNVPYHNN